MSMSDEFVGCSLEDVIKKVKLIEKSLIKRLDNKPDNVSTLAYNSSTILLYKFQLNEIFGMVVSLGIKDDCISEAYSYIKQENFAMYGDTMKAEISKALKKLVRELKKVEV